MSALISLAQIDVCIAAATISWYLSITPYDPLLESCLPRSHRLPSASNRWPLKMWVYRPVKIERVVWLTLTGTNIFIHLCHISALSCGYGSWFPQCMYCRSVFFRTWNWPRLDRGMHDACMGILHVSLRQAFGEDQETPWSHLLFRSLGELGDINSHFVNGVVITDGSQYCNDFTLYIILYYYIAMWSSLSSPWHSVIDIHLIVTLRCGLAHTDCLW